MSDCIIMYLCLLRSIIETTTSSAFILIHCACLQSLLILSMLGRDLCTKRSSRRLEVILCQVFCFENTQNRTSTVRVHNIVSLCVESYSQHATSFKSSHYDIFKACQNTFFLTRCAVDLLNKN